MLSCHSALLDSIEIPNNPIMTARICLGIGYSRTGGTRALRDHAAKADEPRSTHLRTCLGCAGGGAEPHARH